MAGRRQGRARAVSFGSRRSDPRGPARVRRDGVRYRAARAGQDPKETAWVRGKGGGARARLSSSSRFPSAGRPGIDGEPLRMRNARPRPAGSTSAPGPRSPPAAPPPGCADRMTANPAGATGPCRRHGWPRPVRGQSEADRGRNESDHRQPRTATSHPRRAVPGRVTARPTRAGVGPQSSRGRAETNRVGARTGRRQAGPDRRSTAARWGRRMTRGGSGGHGSTTGSVREPAARSVFVPARRRRPCTAAPDGDGRLGSGEGAAHCDGPARTTPSPAGRRCRTTDPGRPPARARGRPPGVWIRSHGRRPSRPAGRGGAPPCDRLGVRCEGRGSPALTRAPTLFTAVRAGGVVPSRTVRTCGWRGGASPLARRDKTDRFG